MEQRRMTMRSFVLSTSAILLATTAFAQMPPPPGVPVPGALNTMVQGRVQRLLRGPAGDVDGALLDDGTVLRMPPHIAYQFATLLAPGRTVAAQGWGLNTAFGRVIDVQSVG